MATNYSRGVKRNWQEKLRALRQVPARSPTPRKKSWKEKLVDLRAAPPPAPTVHRVAVPSGIITTPRSIAVVAHAFDGHDGLSKVAASLARGFAELGWRVHSIVGQGHWWSRVPRDVEITLVAVYPNALAEPLARDVPGRFMRYTMFEHPTLPADWVTVLNRASRVFVTLPAVAEAMKRSGVAVPVESIGFGWQWPMPAKFADRATRTRIGCLSVAGERKGMLELVEGFTRAKVERPALRLHIHSRLVSEPAYSERLRARSRDLPGFVFTEGDWSEGQLSAWWNGLDAYALVSRGEGLSVTPREAVARALPSVLSDIEAHQELINNGWALGVTQAPDDIARALVELHDLKLPEPRPFNTKSWSQVASDIAREPKTVFYWCQMSERCGVAEYVRQLKEVALDASDCGSTVQIGRTRHAVFVLMPGYGDKIAQIRASIQRLKTLGVRVTLDVHHYNAANVFSSLFSLVDDVVWHHPRAPYESRVGRYVPLPVPTVKQEQVRYLGGLVHFGIWAPNKRFDVMARAAENLGTRLYIYGHNNARVVQTLPDHLRPLVYVEDSFPPPERLATILRQHDVGLIGRLPWHGQGSQLHGAASPRFFIAAGLPAVIDEAEPHEDLRDALDVVSFSDFDKLVARIYRLTHDAEYRAVALRRAASYATENSPREVARRMGIETV